jgi:glucokinase-like ROK family protein
VEETKRSGSLGSLRALNRSRVIDTLRQLGVASRAEIARRTGLSRSTVSSLVGELQESGVITERQGNGEGSATARGGRPPTLIALDPSVGVAIGVDFGKTHVAAAASDLSHTILAESRREMEGDYDASAGFEAGEQLVAEVLAEAKVDRDVVIGAGLGVPGPIHLQTGTVGSSAILPGWNEVRVAEEFGARLRLPVHVDNDANLAALAELHWGAGRNASNLVYLTAGTGIGSGIVIDGRLYRGAGGTAGEIGHTTIDEGGSICRCGSRGCLETFAAMPAILELLKPSLGEDLTPEAVIEQAADGDLACQRAIGDAGRHLGAALANLCNLVNPERIVVGGSLAQAGDTLLNPMRETVQRRAIVSAAKDVEVVRGELSERAEMLGAVALVLYEVEATTSF